MKKIEFDDCWIDSWRDPFFQINDDYKLYLLIEKNELVWLEERPEETFIHIKTIIPHGEYHEIFSEFLNKNKAEIPAGVIDIYNKLESIGATLQTAERYDYDLRNKWHEYIQEQEWDIKIFHIKKQFKELGYDIKIIN